MWFSVSRRLKIKLHNVLRISETIHSCCFGSSSNMGRFGLFKKISPLGDPESSIRPVLDEWLRDGKSVNKPQLRQTIKELTKYRRFRHALEVSEWMCDTLYYAPSTADFGSRLHLISRVHGLERAEEYFNNIPNRMKDGVVYSNLLNCYAHEMSAEKAEETMQTMKDMGVAKDALCYNLMMNMYYKMNSHEKLDALMLEMEQKGIPCDQFTLSIRLSAYAAVSDIEGMEKTVEKLASIPHEAVDWRIYSVAANGYLKVKRIDEAIVMLKKCEELMNEKTGNEAFHNLLNCYADTGRKEELCRIWSQFKAQRKVYNKGYMAMISSALKLDDIELGEKIFKDWESKELSYDFRIPNLLIRAYCEKGLTEKAELLLRKAEVKWIYPSSDAYYSLANKYLEDNEISKLTEVIERAVTMHSSEVDPEKEIWSVCLEYLKGKGDRKQLGEFIEKLRIKNIFSEAALERLRDPSPKRFETENVFVSFRAWVSPKSHI